jgi:photosystem II stability/assembly factor-like uncharacterized protein
MKTSKSFYVSVVIAFSMLYNTAYSQSQWTQQATSLPDTVIPAFVSAVDENTAWAAGIALWYSFPSQSFVKTTDGGETWTAGTIPGVPNYSFCSIYALDGIVAWVTMFDHTNATIGGVFKTTDGGATWVQQTTAFPGSGNYITFVYFFDAANGVCVGNERDDYFEIYTTSDGGDNWTRLPSGNIPNPHSGEHGLVSNFAASGDNTLWFGTNKGRVFRTTDRGMTWDAYYAGLGTNMIGVAFQNPTNGLAIALLTSTIMAAKTTDGGMTWTPLTKLPPIAGLISYVPGTSSSYVMGSIFGTEESQPGSAYTNDGGESWTLVDSLGHGNASFVNPSTGWSGNTESNAIYKWSGPPLFDAIDWTVYNTSNSGLPHNSVRSIAIDRNGNKWIGTYGGGLAKFDGANWDVYNTSNSDLPSNTVLSVAIDGSGTKWIGTGDDGGLALFDGINWTVHNTTNSGLPSDYVASIAIDESSNKWIATLDDGGLAKFDGANWDVYNTSNSDIPSNYVYSVVIDGSGKKWIGTADGLAEFDGTDWRVYDTSNSGLPSNYVASIAIDGSGNKWIGTGLNFFPPIFGEGLVLFDGTDWTVYNTSNCELPSNHVFSIAIDGNGNKWIGTRSDGGLGKFDGTNWTVFNTYNSGLPYNQVNSIVIDGRGNKWIGTGGGLAVYNQGGIITSVQGKHIISPIPSQFELEQNYPNPFNPTTAIRYSTSKLSFVSIKVYDVLGKVITTLVNEEKPAGNYEVEFNASNLSSGVYFYRLQAGSYVEIKKMMLMK